MKSRLALVAVALALSAPLDAATVSYNRDIRPILSDNCFHCHGPDKNTRDGGRRLDLPDGAFADIDGIRAIVPGKPDESDAIIRIFSDDKDEVMPPPKAHKTLTKKQKDLVKRWVAEGAKYEPHWAYAPLVRPAVPGRGGKAGGGAGQRQGSEDLVETVHNPIDAFIQQTLAEKKLKPAPEADRRTLIRRLSLDLTGLPPRPDEVAAFLEDRDTQAYEQLADRLLASPRFGERMAQQWLDLARYADTVGFHGDQNQNVWAYRDWVIAAFNDNKPFDQFTTEQLAGDLLPNPTPGQLTATCFNRLNMMTREGGAQAKEYLVKYTHDRIRTVSTTWLGSTFGCAECHDHKFDPISQKDFYSLGAFFADVKQWGVYADYRYTPNPDLKGFTNDHPFPPELIVESAALKRRLDAVRERIAGIVRDAEPPPEKLAAWQASAGDFLKKHPSGWETPKAKITVKPARPEHTQAADGRIVVEVRPAREIQLDIAPTAAQLAAIRLELLPDAKAGNRILRGDGAETERPTFELVRKNAAPIPIEIRHAQADHAAPRYDSGYEILGVQAGWKLGDPAKSHTAVFFPREPLQLAPGDLLSVRFPENLLASLRVSTSPLAPLDVQHPRFPQQLAAAIADPQGAREYYLRATAWHPGAFARLRDADTDLLACRDGRTPVLVTERTDRPLTIRILPRGNWQDESGEICEPATPHFLPALPDAAGRKLTRLDLAKWLVSPENPLTARVVVNRLWRQFFGAGLSAQTDDLGAQGEAPSHPELLDWLAAEFRDGTGGGGHPAAQEKNGRLESRPSQSPWDIKHIIRLIVTSHTYRQVAGLRPELRDLDPQNRLLSTQNPRRLDAEFIRDNALAIAGLLNLEMGGPASKPYQPAGLYADLQFPDRDYVADTGPGQWRRGVYMWWQRTFLHPMLLNFDAPSREDCTAMRTAANTPQQALTLLNDPQFVEAARVWAARLLSEEKDDPARLDTAFQQALARSPRPAEKAALLTALAEAREQYRNRPADAPKLAKIGHAPAPNADPIDQAAWTNLCRVILNLHETLTRY